MQTTLRIDDQIYRRAKAEAARTGVTLTHFIEQALLRSLEGNGAAEADDGIAAEIAERNKLMEALLRRTAHFRIGPKPTREEMNER